MNSQVKLAHALQIGFSGHRNLSNERLCHAAISRVLSEWKEKWPEGISGISSLAAGGDLIFAKACFELNIPLQVLLPLPEEEFKKDFDAQNWSDVETELNRVARIELAGAGTSRPDCYYECGLETIHRCGLLIVLWNGLPAAGIGGTGELVRQARSLEAPVIWIHSETQEIVRWNTDNLKLEDRELSRLNELPDVGVVSISNPQDRATAWLSKLDENAINVAPRFRRIVAIPILCAGVGSVSAAAADIYEKQSSFLLIVSAILGLAAFFAPRLLKAKERQQRRAMIRTAAEVSRSFMALWDSSTYYDVIGKTELAELGGMVAALNHLKLVAGYRDRGNDIAAFKAAYYKERIEDQADYYLRESSKADSVMSYARVIIRISVFASIVGNLVILAAKGLQWLPNGEWTSDLGLGTALALQIAAGIGAMTAINDYSRRQQRYAETRSLILNYGRLLKEAQSWPSVQRIVTTVERTLLAEVMEWRTLFRNQRFGK